MSMLMARRLVEAGVPFVTVFWKGDPKLDTLCKSGGGWDTHGNNFNCLKDHLLPEFDRCFSALLGRPARARPARQHAGAGQQRDGPEAAQSAIRARAARRGRAAITGRTACRVLLAGGGIRGGQAYGSLRQGGGLSGRPQGRRPRTSPAPCITPWASRTWKRPTAKAGPSTCSPTAR